VTQNAMGEFLVDFGQYGWFPPVLPSETEEADSSDEDEDEDEGEDEEAADAAAYHT
jgi:methylated-DNA-protein-cysteine methyltransferase-like protein